MTEANTMNKNMKHNKTANRKNVIKRKRERQKNNTNKMIDTLTKKRMMRMRAFSTSHSKSSCNFA